MTDDLSGELAEVKAAAAAAGAALDEQPTVCSACGQSVGVDPNGMLAAATSNDELKLLIAIRNKLSEAIEDCPMRDLSPLTRRLQDVIKEIREIEERRTKESGTTKKAGEGGVDKSEGEWDPTTDV